MGACTLAPSSSRTTTYPAVPATLPLSSIALPQQAALTSILLRNNGHLCQRSAAIQLAYSRLAAAAALPWSRLSALLQLCQDMLHFSPEMHSCGQPCLQPPPARKRRCERPV